jgi:hypothetical protein
MTSRFALAMWLTTWCALAAPAAGQTSYPMLMSLKPVAVQAGATTECTVTSRYSMHGATQVLVSGEGVSAEVIHPQTKPDDKDKPPNLQSLKLRFTVAGDALPGVRDFRLITPQGASTVGQLVVARDPVVVEAAGNDTLEKAQAVSIPATLCGCFEKAEDVDFFKFRAAAGSQWTFHVRSMRLQDRIHDLQTHADPILSLRNASGTTLATNDNFFYGDPFLSYRFEQEGEYWLEIRDVRYQGNPYWEYSIEVSDRPFVTQVHPLALPRGQAAQVELVGFHLPGEPMATLQAPMETPCGPQWLRLPLGQDVTNPAPVVVCETAPQLEAAGDNNAPERAQPIPIPGGVSGRIESESDIDCFVFEAKAGQRYSFEVQARRLQSALDSHLRILNDQGNQLAQNDDAQRGRLAVADSWIENWAAPADGKYIVEIRDLHLRGGPEYVYFLHLTPALPYFELYLDTDKTQLTPGTSAAIFCRVVRKNGFQGEVQLAIDGLPPGVTASCGRVLAGKGQDGVIILTAAPDAPQGASNIRVTGTATHKEGEAEPLVLSAAAQPLQEIYLPGGGRGHWQVDMHTVAVAAPSDIRKVKLSTYEVSLKPGQSQKIDIEIERAPDFKANVTLDVLFQHLNSVYGNCLPEGVTMDAKNSKTLLTGGQTQGHITLTAAGNAPPVEKQQLAVMANVSINFVMKATYSAEPLLVTVQEK